MSLAKTKSNRNFLVRAATSAAMQFKAFLTGGESARYGSGDRVSLSTRIVYPGSSFDWQSLAGRMWENSAVMSCTGWMQRTLPEARLTVQRTEVARGITTKVFIDDHPFVALIEEPHPDLTIDTVLQAVVFSLVTDGNAYVYMARDKLGTVRELWYLPHDSILPRRVQGSTDFVSYYEYYSNGGQLQKLDPKKDIIHFRFGVNPNNLMLGMTPLISGTKEVVADNEANSYEVALMKNMGVPSVLLNPDDPNAEVNDETKEDLEDWWRTSFTGDGRGKPLIPSIKIKIEKLGLTPEELALDKIRIYPETRICALLGIPPMVVGFASGSGQKTYANYREAREAALENNIIPTQKFIASTFQKRLMPEFGVSRQDRVTWDYSDVRALSDEMNKRWTRVITAMQAGLLTVDEARSKLGLPLLGPDRGGDERAPIAPLSGRANQSLQSQSVDGGPTLDRPRPEGD